MSELRFGATIGAGVSARETVRLCTLAEDLGYDSVWVPDHLVDIPSSGFDPWTTLAAIGARTKRVFLCPGVTDYQRCHPAKIAHIVSTVDELSGGRAGLGIGAGEAMNIVPYGIEWEKPFVRVERLKEAVQVIKLLWSSSRDKTVTFQGRFYRLDRAWLDQHPTQRPHPPIYIGALGNKRTLEIAGEVGDGWLPWINCPESWKKRLEIVRRGAERAKRSLKDMDLCARMYCVISKDSEAYQKALSRLKVFLLFDRYQLRMLDYDIPLPIDYAYQHIRATREVEKTIVETAKQIPDDVMEKGFIPVGGPEDIIETISTFVKLGATHICFSDLLNLEEGLKKFSQEVMPYFREQETV